MSTEPITSPAAAQASRHASRATQPHASAQGFLLALSDALGQPADPTADLLREADAALAASSSSTPDPHRSLAGLLRKRPGGTAENDAGGKDRPIVPGALPAPDAQAAGLIWMAQALPPANTSAPAAETSQAIEGIERQGPAKRHRLAARAQLGHAKPPGTPENVARPDRGRAKAHAAEIAASGQTLPQRDATPAASAGAPTAATGTGDRVEGLSAGAAKADHPAAGMPAAAAPGLDALPRHAEAHDMSHTAHPPARPDIAPMIGPIAAERPAPVARTPELSVRVGETGWDQGLGERMVLMAGKREQVAELHLNPPELGPLKIVLTLADDQASAQFVSAHAPVRDAVEQALPRLQQMLADNGITLGNASVSAETFRQPEQQASERGAPRPAMSEDAPPAMHASAPLRALRGLVDTFA